MHDRDGPGKLDSVCYWSPTLRQSRLGKPPGGLSAAARRGGDRTPIHAGTGFGGGRTLGLSVSRYSCHNVVVYKRRVILLGVVEASGGVLGRTDCMKLLFMLEHEGLVRDCYEFFPHHYGPFSYEVMRDKRRLTAQGYLGDEEAFELTEDGRRVLALSAPQRSTIQASVSSIGTARGRELLRRVYLTYPSYCCRSRVMADVLSDAERLAVCSQWNMDESPQLFTIGYEGRTIDAVLHLLITNNVRAVVDVRRNAVSMKYGFSKKSLERYLLASGIDYVHCAELGISSSARAGLDTRASYECLFEMYRREIVPQASGSLRTILRLLEEKRRVALLCFEADPSSCHRHVVGQVLVASSGVSLQDV